MADNRRGKKPKPPNSTARKKSFVRIYL